jgi:hypothetical protein
MSELVSDDIKGGVIEAAGYGAAGFAGASVGAAISKLDGAISQFNAQVDHNVLMTGEVYGPLALGAVAGVLLMRKLINAS